MIKTVYLFAIFLGNLTFIHATDIFDKTSESSGMSLGLEWIGLIVLALTGFIFIFRSARQIKKIKKLQDELDTYHLTVSNELDTLGEKNA